jgi:cytochrome oxidase Cu insertion factor (SCO1/SenC/PrrC family)
LASVLIGLTEEELDEMDDYLVDHTIFFYFMGPDGLIRSYFGQQMTSEEISAGIVQAMNDDSEREKGPSWWNVLLGKN